MMHYLRSDNFQKLYLHYLLNMSNKKKVVFLHISMKSSYLQRNVSMKIFIYLKKDLHVQHPMYFQVNSYIKSCHPYEFQGHFFYSSCNKPSLHKISNAVIPFYFIFPFILPYLNSYFFFPIFLHFYHIRLIFDQARN